MGANTTGATSHDMVVDASSKEKDLVVLNASGVKSPPVSTNQDELAERESAEEQDKSRSTISGNVTDAMTEDAANVPIVTNINNDTSNDDGDAHVRVVDDDVDDDDDDGDDTSGDGSHAARNGSDASTTLHGDIDKTATHDHKVDNGVECGHKADLLGQTTRVHERDANDCEDTNKRQRIARQMSHRDATSSPKSDRSHQQQLTSGNVECSNGGGGGALTASAQMAAHADSLLKLSQTFPRLISDNLVKLPFFSFLSILR